MKNHTVQCAYHAPVHDAWLEANNVKRQPARVRGQGISTSACLRSCSALTAASAAARSPSSASAARAASMTCSAASSISCGGASG